MAARILDGRALGRRLNKRLKDLVPSLPRPPGLAVVLVGSDPASQVYVRRKGVVAGRLGFHHEQVDLPATATQDEVLAVVRRLEADPRVDGLLVQLPLPGHIDADAVVSSIDPAMDVDGLTPTNAGLSALGRSALLSCTPLGVMRLLAEGEVELKGAEAVVLGRSNMVGRPMARFLEQAHATVTVCHSRTRDVEAAVRRADVLVAAVGRPHFVPGEWIKPGAVVIDVGIHRAEDGGLIGDVDFEAASQRASAITPVPGGVGPLTIAMLMENTFRASALAQGLDADALLAC